MINGLFSRDFRYASLMSRQLLEAMNYDAYCLPIRYTSVRHLQVVLPCQN